jgi:hypothetical protein
MITFTVIAFFVVIALILIFCLIFCLIFVVEESRDEKVRIIAAITTLILLSGLFILFKYSLTHSMEIIEYVFYK